jgi:hypothetical protein
MLKRSTIDSRTGIDRRKGFNLEVMDTLGVERRKSKRRVLPEQRKEWLQMPNRVSICVKCLS